MVREQRDRMVQNVLSQVPLAAVLVPCPLASREEPHVLPLGESVRLVAVPRSRHVIALASRRGGCASCHVTAPGVAVLGDFTGDWGGSTRVGSGGRRL